MVVGLLVGLVMVSFLFFSGFFFLSLILSSSYHLPFYLKNSIFFLLSLFNLVFLSSSGSFVSCFATISLGNDEGYGVSVYAL